MSAATYVAWDHRFWFLGQGKGADGAFTGEVAAAD
jgi:hypothetical protein